MIAIGLPGQMPRIWAQSTHDAVVLAQMRAGEVATAADLDENGQPVPAAMPAVSDWPRASADAAVPHE